MISRCDASLRSNTGTDPKALFAVLLAVVLLFCSYTVQAQQVRWTLQFESGHDFLVKSTINSTPASGPITIVGTTDVSSPDLSGSATGEFELDTVTFTGAGFTEALVSTPLSVYVFSDVNSRPRFSIGLLGDVNNGVAGWNGTTANGLDFTEDLDDLFVIENWTSQITSTFWNNVVEDGAFDYRWQLESGELLVADIGASAVSGTATIEVIPEPSSLALLGLGGLLIARRRR